MITSFVRMRHDWLKPVSRVVAAALALSLSACLPKDVSIPNVTVSTTSETHYEGFTGAVSVDTIGATKLKVKWSAATDQKVVAYNVYDASAFFSPALLKTVPAPATEVTLT